MSDADIEYWRTKYALLEEQFQIQRKRNEELEDRLLLMVEKIESEKKQLADEIDTLTRKLERFSSRESRGDDCVENEPEDPSTSNCVSAGVQLFRVPGKEVTLGAPATTAQVKGYHHLPVLSLDEGIIYGFRWEKGSVVKVV
ncbi:hypothetical protein Q1695_002704 [Nippostrongylus brasiliensis]|nr:hypothetical protein Q1695_002704 [Nippostrongylus brasiliensis]